MNNNYQVFTPKEYVKSMLDDLEYKHGLRGRKILDNSCGNGNFLIEIVKRYIKDCEMDNLSKEQIKEGLQRDVFGTEIDSKTRDECISRLNMLAEEYGIPSVDWQVDVADYLKKEDSFKYDFIVGNPPYISYSELKKEDRNFLKEKFLSCKKGKFDYCYAFIEKSIDSLSPNGVMAYLIPSSVFKTVFGDKIRNKMHPYVHKIIGYSNKNVFKDATVKSSIIIMKKCNNLNMVRYIDESINLNRCFSRELLSGKWIFDYKFEGICRFGDYFKVSHVVATLCNKVFLLKDGMIDESGNYRIGREFIESGIIRETTSPKLLRKNEKMNIIFPYMYDDCHKLIRYDEKELKEKFPGAFRYLLKRKKMLILRDSDQSAKWFEYGRSQALNSLDCEKLLISTVISTDIPIYKIDRWCIPYSGMFITPKGVDLSLEDGFQILKSERFMNYAREIGIPINGRSVRITSKDIENYF